MTCLAIAAGDAIPRIFLSDVSVWRMTSFACLSPNLVLYCDSHAGRACMAIIREILWFVFKFWVRTLGDYK